MNVLVFMRARLPAAFAIRQIGVKAAFFDAADADMHLCPGDAAFCRSAAVNFDAAEAEIPHSMQKQILIGQQFQKSCHEHVAGGAHAAF